MRIGHFLVSAAAVGLVAQISAAAAPRAVPGEVWIGTWGYVSAPPPPGPVPPPAIPVPQSTSTPLGAPIAQPVSAAAPPPPLLDNPGRLPIDLVATDLLNVTVRQVARVSAGGQRLRLRLSNEGGADPLVLGSIHVGEAGADGALISGSDHAVTFSGQSGVIIPPGAPVLSDSIDLPTQPLARLYISIHVPGTVGARAPRSSFQYVAGTPGDFTAAAELPKVRLMRVPVFVTLIEVQAVKPTSVVVALGDSITEGAAATANAFRSWPDRLGERLSGRGWAVVNAGISGNRLLRYGAGPNALARFDRDVLSVPGVKAIILLEGINDIGRGFAVAGSTEPAPLEALQAADRQIVARAHEHGIRVIGATLTPYQGAAYASPAGEAVREALNSWIKSSGVFDAVIDFAPAVADPADPLSFARQYNDRDHLHPNDAGYRAMADAVDLTVITGK